MTDSDFLTSTRVFYDTIAADYASRYGDSLGSNPYDRAVLSLFAELVRTGGGGPVVEAGCGEGRVTAHLDGLGLDVSGVDLSPGMLAQARRAYPGIRFTEGSLFDLDLPDGGLTGLAAWYSIIHMPPHRLPDAFAEFRRVLAPDGLLLLAFQVGEEPLRVADAWGHPVSLDFHRRDPDEIESLLRGSGFEPWTRMVRRAEADESAPQAYLLARRRDSATGQCGSQDRP
ncbi:methyltransferase domain-containing protein [Streptomyces sp. B-S-A8]|uniref:Methyltransferase domain-containing protein n=2 Tax=Streptomyces solicavernae TaxID=3043614 RepID=A0ABT6RMR2_9ACTN|nr:class I SAM-dependent methyltransferase [Streptomyces sp. B-S-A8]MDI3384971.1 methyltransferase domain-containing protein [Streptomyces sp. B-S-A8]